MSSSSYNGLLVIDKPAGITSHDVVNRVRRRLGLRRVGHAGTLDPAATGVLLVGVGRATRLLGFIQNLAKGYRAQVVFGATTTTQDTEGEVVETRTCAFSRKDLEEVGARFVGDIEQTPPMVSAVKVGGEALYRKARRGEVIERQPRKVRIYELLLLEFETDGLKAVFDVVCSSGTYIRTLAADLGEALGCGAHLGSLRRTRIGSFGQDEAHLLETIESMDAEAASEILLPMSEAMRDFPQITVDEQSYVAVSHGRSLPLTETTEPRRTGELPTLSSPNKVRGGHTPGMSAGIPVAVLDSKGDLIAVYRRGRDALKAIAVVAAD